MRGAFLHTISQSKSEGPAEIHKQIVTVYGNVINPLVSSPKEHLAGKNFDDDDEVQEEVIRCFKG